VLATLPVKGGKCRHYLYSEHRLKRNSHPEYQEYRGERFHLKPKKYREESGGLSSLSANWWRILRQHLNCPLPKLLLSHLPYLHPKQLFQQVFLLREVYLVSRLCAFSIKSQNHSEKHTKGYLA
jgi:hypothetical protein